MLIIQNLKLFKFEIIEMDHKLKLLLNIENNFSFKIPNKEK